MTALMESRTGRSAPVRPALSEVRAGPSVRVAARGALCDEARTFLIWCAREG